MVAQFGSQFSATVAHSAYTGGRWSAGELAPLAEFAMHPAAHVLHYGSTCFEGLKAYRHGDGSVHIFRLDRHVARLANSARLLCLPVPPADQLESMIRGLVETVRDDIPEYPSALYLRPLLFGTDANIGSAARPSNDATLYILASPVGEYFEKGEQALRLWVEDKQMRTSPHFGQVKTGGNYAAALAIVTAAKARYAVDQVLFCPGGDVQETAAANFLLIDDRQVVTKRLDGTILPGVTRASILELAADLGYTVEERDIGLEEVFAWVSQGEAALSGTAAVLTGVGMLLHDNDEHPVNGGQVGPNTIRLRQALMDIHSGRAPDRFGWLSAV